MIRSASILAAAALIASPAMAANYTWTGTDSDLWDVANNWVGSGFPVAGDQANINLAGATVDVNGSQAANQVRIGNTAGNVTISGSGTPLLSIGDEGFDRLSNAEGVTTMNAPIKWLPTGGSKTLFDLGGNGSINIGGNIVIAPTYVGSQIQTIAKTYGTVNATISGNISFDETTGVVSRAYFQPGSSGSLTMSGTNTFGFNTDMRITSDGTVFVGNAAGLGSATVNGNGKVNFSNSGSENDGNYNGTSSLSVLSNQALTMRNEYAGLTNVRRHVLGADHATGTSKLLGEVEIQRVNDTVTTLSAVELTSKQAGGTMEFAGAISTSGTTATRNQDRPIEVTGAGEVVFSAPNDTTSAVTVKSGGTLIANGDHVAATTVNLAWTPGSNTATVVSGSTADLRIGQAASGAFMTTTGNTIQGISGNTLTMLQYQTNTQTNRAQTFAAGSATGFGALTVEANATLGGTGTIAQSGTAGATINGTLAPGNSIGTIEFDGGLTSGTVLTMNNGSKVLFELGAANASDQVELWNYVAGDLATSGTVTLDFVDAQEGTYKLFEFFSDSGSTLAASGITSGFTLGSGLDGFDATLDYNTSDITLTLAVVPEPASLALMGLGAAMMIVRRRQA